MTPATTALADGGTLSWYEYGDPAAGPFPFVPATATSGRAGAALHAAAAAGSVRLIDADPPGLGHCDPACDARSLSRPWGFNPGDIAVPVDWWHGEKDTNVTPAAGRAITSRMP
jgi:hypothetical protein